LLVSLLGGNALSAALPIAAELEVRVGVVVPPMVRPLMLLPSDGSIGDGSSNGGGRSVATDMRWLREGRSGDGGGEGKDSENLHRMDHFSEFSLVCGAAGLGRAASVSASQTVVL
jgi:hypothetical protein